MIKIKQNKKKSHFFSSTTLKKFLNTNFFSAATRQIIIVGALFLLFTLIVLKLINLQIFQHSNKDQFIQSTVYKENEELQQRGFIFDRNKNVLAMSVKTYTLSVDAKMMPDIKAIENLLAKYNIHFSSSNYKAIEAKKRYIPIQSNISEITILQIKEDIVNERKKIRARIRQLKKDIKHHKKDTEKREQYRAELNEIKEDKYICLKIEGKYKRIYPEKELAAHVIGKVNSENIGTNGIEKFCNEQLNGEKIKRQKMVINNYKSVFLDSV